MELGLRFQRLCPKCDTISKSCYLKLILGNSHNGSAKPVVRILRITIDAVGLIVAGCVAAAQRRE